MNAVATAKWDTGKTLIEEWLITHPQGYNVPPRVEHTIPQGSDGGASTRQHVL